YGGLVAIALLIALLGLYPFRLSFTGDRLSQLLVGYSRPDLTLLLFVAFGIAGFLSVRGILRAGRASVVALVLSASLSFAIEMLQAFDPGQVSSSTDALLAIMAAGVGVVAAWSKLAWITCASCSRAFKIRGAEPDSPIPCPAGPATKRQ